MTRAMTLGVCLSVMLAGNAYAQQTIGTCAVLPANNIWNTAVDRVPVRADSTTLVNTIGATRGLHADFGAAIWDGGPIGIPFVTVAGTQPKYSASFLYADESEAGPYAVPLNAPIEGGSASTGDRHAIAIDTDNCRLYELYRAFPQATSWTADAGAIFDLRSNALRPSGWTSADAAGLPILPGLVTYEEVQSGEIRHAIRFTAPQTRRAFVWPARHYASSLTGTQYPRMGERFRLKASFDITPFPADVQVILRAMKKYGIILADNGSAWYISGKPDPRWNDDNLHTLGQLPGSSFEAIDATVLQVSADSGEALQTGVSVSVAPATATLRAGATQTFAATVTGASGGVTWTVNDIAGGDGTVGTIDATGLYQAPFTVPLPNVVTVRATSATSPASSGTATVTVLPQPAITSLSPATLTVGAFTMTVNGVGFVSGAVVTFDGTAVATTFVSSTKLTVSGTATQPDPSVSVVARMPDGTASAAVDSSIAAAPVVSISMSPGSASVRVKQSVQFTATVQGTTNKSVTWKVNNVAGGNSTVGTVSASGLYRAPTSVPRPATVTVSATSVADSTRIGTASATITKR